MLAISVDYTANHGSENILVIASEVDVTVTLPDPRETCGATTDTPGEVPQSTAPLSMVTGAIYRISNALTADNVIVTDGTNQITLAPNVGVTLQAVMYGLRGAYIPIALVTGGDAYTLVTGP